jgi:hypothetical protein
MSDVVQSVLLQPISHDMLTPGQNQAVQHHYKRHSRGVSEETQAPEDFSDAQAVER